MNRDRMGTLLRVRELVERRRLAEQAEAARAANDARAAHRSAIAARAAADPPVGVVVRPAALAALRCSAIALDDAVTWTDTQRSAASHQLASAEQRTIAAAIERRSAERLRDRRDAMRAAEQAKVEARRADDVALQVWRTR